jgi:hypothetical protein
MVFRRPSKGNEERQTAIAAVRLIRQLIAKGLPPKFVWPIGGLGANALQLVLCDWVRAQVLHVLHPYCTQRAILIEISAPVFV